MTVRQANENDDIGAVDMASVGAILFEVFETPIGPLTIAADDVGLRHIEFAKNKYPVVRAGWRASADAAHPSAHPQAYATLRAARAQLEAYFAGLRRDFDLPLAPQGTPFQCAVWRTLAKIPYGCTWSYRELARAIGKPDAMRAVGAANGRNPLPIVLPCHRVIGADGSLTGFGGGLPTKALLLRLEGVAVDEPPVTADLFG
jgi:methylated-DNA-[protein]-cysteine S-methyltransferase